jgi:nicotinate dehydrogenase subunit B
MKRREFLKSAGAIVVGFSLGGTGVLAQQGPRLPGSLNANRMLDGWVRINADGSVTIFTGKCELGQGILTALAQIASDELDVAYERIDMVSADTARTPNEGNTAGSLSVENSGTALHYACAEARHILLGLAAAKLGVPAEKLAVSDGTISGGGGKVTYAELAKSVDLKREATARVKPKPPSQHKAIGKSQQRRDIPSKVTGGPSYAQDVRLPGMVFGRVVRPPSYRAELVSFDEGAIKAMPGVVTVMRDGSFLAVAAEREEQAINASRALRASAKWRESPDLPPPAPGLFDHLQTMRSMDKVVSEKTPEAPAGGQIVRTLDATYTRPFQSHGSIGPSCAVAQFKDGRYTLWTHSQGVFPLRVDLAKVLRVPVDRIHCRHVEGSGCYGHNGADDVACDAALLARGTNGRPVKLQWMRDDEFSWEPYGSAMVMKMRARIGEDGGIVDWRHDVWSHPHSTRPTAGGGPNLLAGWHIANPVGGPMFGASPPGPPPNQAERNATPTYDFPGQKIVLHYLTDMPIRTSALRTLGAYSNVFALESFFDEAASAAGADPVEYRLRHMKDPRARAVIEECASRAGWKPGARSDGTHGRGFAYSQYKNGACYVALALDVEVDRRTGRVRVTKAVSAVDAGLIINPDGIVNQIEGGIIQSASWTLKEVVGHDRQRITTRSWADYPILTFPEVPAVEVHLINRPNERSLGTGEGSQGPTVAAISNAVFHATGVRLRDLPFHAQRVKAALAQAPSRPA